MVLAGIHVPTEKKIVILSFILAFAMRWERQCLVITL